MLPTPYYEEDGITIYNADCREILPHIPRVDLVLTDPPYGIQKWDWDENYPEGIEFELIKCAPTIAVMCGQWAIPKCINACGDEFLGIIALHNRNGMTFSPVGFGNWIPVILAGRRPKQGQDLLSFNVTGDKPEHPSPKPIAAMNRLVQRLTDEGQTILDPFMGSGTTLVAAKQLHRKAIGIEIEEKYCQIAVRRFRTRGTTPMIDHINLRCTLYPLTHACSGYSKRSNKCCSCTATESVERTGCKPDDGTGEQGLNNNQEAQEDINHFCNPQTYDESYWGCPATGHPCPKKLKDGEG